MVTLPLWTVDGHPIVVRTGPATGSRSDFSRNLQPLDKADVPQTFQ
jgi:hypothetical protein